MAEAGFSSSAYDGGLFFVRNDAGTLLAVVLVHVDDFLLLTKDEFIKDTLNEFLVKRFKKVTLEGLSNFCGLTIKKDDDGCVHVNQQHYLATLGDSIDIEDDIKKYSNGKRWKIAPWDSQASTLLFGKNDEKNTY